MAGLLLAGCGDGGGGGPSGPGDGGSANQSPTADFSMTCEGLTCSFDGSASSDPDDALADLTFEWDFGDGETGTGQTAEHTYAESDTFEVALAVSDPAGAADTTSRTREVGFPNKSPRVLFTFACDDRTCGFAAGSSEDPDGEIQVAETRWEFGDGAVDTTGVDSVRHDYTPGDYTVTLHMVDDDGDTTEVERNLHVVNEEPRGDFILTPGATQGNLGCEKDEKWQQKTPWAECSFDASEDDHSVDIDGFISSFAWDFATGGTIGQGVGDMPTQTYGPAPDAPAPQPTATYNVRLDVTDNNDGPRSPKMSRFNRQNGLGNNPPVPQFLANCDGLTCVFDATPDAAGTFEPDQQDAIDNDRSYDWDFGDGTVFNDGPASISHTYPAEGLYDVSVSVHDTLGPDGVQATVMRQIPVQRQIALEEKSRSDAKLPLATYLADCREYGCEYDGGESLNATNYRWTFGSQGSATGETTSHTWTPDISTGQYTVTLEVDHGGAKISRLHRTFWLVNNPPRAEWSANCGDDSCSFDATGSSDPDGSITAYNWAVAGGPAWCVAPPAGATTSQTFDVPDGTPVASCNFELTTVDNDGENSRLERDVWLTNQSPVADFRVSCDGLSCEFDGRRQPDESGPPGSFDPDGVIASRTITWDFGDGATAAGSLTASHTFDSGGFYTVELSMEDNDGEASAARRVIEVRSGTVNVQP